MPGTRADFPKGMVNDAYDYAIEKYNEKPLTYPDVFDIEDTSGSYEQYTTVVSAGKLQAVAEAESIPAVNTTEGFTVYCAVKKFGYEFPLTSEAQDDNRKIKNFLKAWAQGVGEGTRATEEEEHFNLFNYGGYTSGHATFLNDIPGVLTTSYGNKCYDSIPFFNVSGSERTAKWGGTYYNGVLLLDLNEANIQKLFQLMTVTNAYDEAGKKVEIIPDTLLMQYGSDNWFTARRIIESPSQVDAAHAGVENLWKSQLRVIGTSYITDSDFWAIGCSKKGLKSLNKKPLTIDYYEDKKNDKNCLRALRRFGRAMTNFRFWAAANFSQS